MKIYLAGFDVFLTNALERGAYMKQFCVEHGFEGLFPFDNDEEAADTAEKIFRSNVDLLNKCHIIIANINQFHGPSADVGTAWETGYAFAAGKKVIVYTSDHRTHREKVDELYGPIVAGHTIDENGVAMGFDDFGEVDNLMITRSAEFIAHSFEEAVLYAKEKYGLKRMLSDMAKNGVWDIETSWEENIEPHWNFIVPPHNE